MDFSRVGLATIRKPCDRNILCYLLDEGKAEQMIADIVSANRTTGELTRVNGHWKGRIAVLWGYNGDTREVAWIFDSAIARSDPYVLRAHIRRDEAEARECIEKILQPHILQQIFD